MNMHFTLPANSCSRALSEAVVTEDQAIIKDVVCH